MNQRTIEFFTHVDKLTHLLGIHYIEVRKEIVDELGGISNMRLICTVNNSISFQCGLVALGEGRAYINLSGKRMKQIGLKKGARVHILLEKDESKYGMEVPEELSELLNQDEVAQKRFELLTPGKKRYIIHYVSNVKSSQLRINRAILLLENLKQLPIGRESFREMLGLGKR